MIYTKREKEISSLRLRTSAVRELSISLIFRYGSQSYCKLITTCRMLRYPSYPYFTYDNISLSLLCTNLCIVFFVFVLFFFAPSSTSLTKRPLLLNLSLLHILPKVLYLTVISIPDMGFLVAHITGGTTNSIALRLIHVEPSRSTLHRFLPDVSLGIVQDIQ